MLFSSEWKSEWKILPLEGSVSCPKRREMNMNTQEKKNKYNPIKKKRKHQITKKNETNPNKNRKKRLKKNSIRKKN